MVGAHVDVTELKNAEAARRASEERLRLAQEAAGLGIWERDLQTGAAVWSAKQWLTGVDPAAGPPDRKRMRAPVLAEDRAALVVERLERDGRSCCPRMAPSATSSASAARSMARCGRCSRSAGCSTARMACRAG